MTTLTIGHTTWRRKPLQLVFYLVTMAWRCYGINNADMVRKLREKEIIESEAVANVMLAVDRKHYCPFSPYVDTTQSIGYNANISAPHMHALVLEILKKHLISGEKALDIGSGSGYLTACMAMMVGQTGKVIGVEHIPELVTLATKNIEYDHPELLASGRIRFITKDGRRGYSAEGPYNAIHVGAAVSKLPQPLIDQLKPGGRLIVPIGPEGGKQNLTQGTPNDQSGIVTGMSDGGFKTSVTHYSEDENNQCLAFEFASNNITWDCPKQCRKIDKAADGTIALKEIKKVTYIPLSNKDHQYNRRILPFPWHLIEVFYTNFSWFYPFPFI